MMVEQRELEVGARPHVRVERVRRDLRVIGQEGETMTALGGPESALKIEQNENLIVIHAQSSLRLQLPQGATLEIGHVGGDLQIEGLSGEVHLGKVGGDATLKDCGGIVADRVGGDVLGRKMAAGVAFKAVGGDVLLEGVQGSVEIRGAGGDISLRALHGPVDAAVGGDTHLVVEEPLHGDLQLQVGGDAYCRLPGSTSAAVDLMAGGDLMVNGPQAVSQNVGRAEFKLGQGKHRIAINAGGDLWLGVGEGAEADIDLDDFGSTLASKVGEKIAEMESALSAMGAEFSSVSSDRIADRVQRIVDRAVRGGHRGVRNGLREALEGLHDDPAHDPVTDDERLKVLQLLEEKKISATEAEQLLDALEG